MIRIAVLVLATAVAAGCAAPPAQRRAGVLEFLYPEGKPATPPADVSLELPVRLGIAFAPEDGSAWSAPITEGEKQRVLQRIRDAFQDVEGVESIEPIPSIYLKPGGGFENVERLHSLLGIDLIALVSYEQTQFSDVNRLSLTYWTIVGAYFVEGNENETHTFVDTSVFDVRSHALLFNAGGRSRVEESSTAHEQSEVLRAGSTEGLEKAVDDMIGQLQVALAAFREQVKQGTVRGACTPAVLVSGSATGGSGAGAAGWPELAFGLAVIGALVARRRAGTA
jgi:rhombotail lipoprotein